MARREDVLRQLDLYRQGLGRHLRQVSDDIIDGEFSETEQEVTLDRRPRRWWAMTSQKRSRQTGSTAAGAGARAPAPARRARAATRAGTGLLHLITRIPPCRDRSSRWWTPSARAMTIHSCASGRWPLQEAQLWLSCIRTEKVAALERLRDPEEDALTGRMSRRWRVKQCRKFDLNFRAFQIASAQLKRTRGLYAFKHADLTGTPSASPCRRTSRRSGRRRF